MKLVLLAILVMATVDAAFGECPDPEVPAHGFIYEGSAPFSEFSSISYACETGYQLIGPDTRQCISDPWVPEALVWDFEAPLCVEEEDCQNPLSIANGTFTFETEMDGVSYGCNEGFNRDGLDIRHCNFGILGGVRPTCYLNHGCVPPAPDSLLHGTFAVYDSPSNTEGDYLWYTCEKGFNIHGSPFRQCRDMAWEGPDPYCTLPGFCLEPVAPENGDVFYTNHANGDTATYTCDPGYEMVGDATLWCEMEVWRGGVTPTCVAPVDDDAADGGDGMDANRIVPWRNSKYRENRFQNNKDLRDIRRRKYCAVYLNRHRNQHYWHRYLN